MDGAAAPAAGSPFKVPEELACTLHARLPRQLRLHAAAAVEGRLDIGVLRRVVAPAGSKATAYVQKTNDYSAIPDRLAAAQERRSDSEREKD
jgi:hypothetical protein